MKKFQYRHERYVVQAKRKNTQEKWTDWTIINNYDSAVMHAKQAEEAGYQSRIIDRGASSNE